MDCASVSGKSGSLKRAQEVVGACNASGDIEEAQPLKQK
jgi:hypothetical protein